MSDAVHYMWRTAPVELKTALRNLVAAEPRIVRSGTRMESVCVFLYDRAFGIDTEIDVLRGVLAMMDPAGVAEYSVEADPTCRKWMDAYNLYNRMRSRAVFERGRLWSRTFDDLGLCWPVLISPTMIRCSLCGCTECACDV